MNDLSRAAAFLTNQIRNLFPDGASTELIESLQASARVRGPFRADDRIQLGSDERNRSVSRLAIGSGTNGWFGASDQTRKLGLDGLSALYLHGLREHNLNFWESADQYGSHPHIGRALKKVERDEVVILTKTVAETATTMRKDLDRFRKELGTDHIDILLLHCMTTADWPTRMRPVMDVISEAQEAGIVGMKGVSCHSFSALEAAVDEPWVEVDLARFNPGGLEMDAGPDAVAAVLERMKAKGKALLGMKVLGNGRLSDHLESSLQFTLGFEPIDAFTMGFKSVAELDEIVGLIAAAGSGD